MEEKGKKFRLKPGRRPSRRGRKASRNVGMDEIMYEACMQRSEELKVTFAEYIRMLVEKDLGKENC